MNFADVKKISIPEGNAIKIERNGVKIWSRLPVGFQEVEYIQSSGTQHLSSGIAPTNNTKMMLKIYSTSTSSFYVSGARATSTSTILFAQSGSVNGSTVLGVVNGTSVVAETGGERWERVSTGQTYESELTTNGDLTFTYSITDIENERQFISTQAHASLEEATTPINIFALSSSNNTITGTSRIYYWKLYQDNILVSHLIPCYRISDNEVGMYDIVRDQFLTNQGSGSFTKGNDI